MQRLIATMAIAGVLVLAGVAGAHDVFGIAPHVTTAVHKGDKTVTLRYQTIELGHGTNFAAMNAGEIQKNEARFNRVLGRLKQIGELETGLPLMIGGKKIEPGKYFMGFSCDAQGNYSVVVSTADDKMTELAREALPLSDCPSKAAFLDQTFSPSADKPDEIVYSVHFGGKAGMLKLAVPAAAPAAPAAPAQPAQPK